MEKEKDNLDMMNDMENASEPTKSDALDYIRAALEESNIPIPEDFAQKLEDAKKISNFEQWQCDVYNQEEGKLSGIHCDICKNKGVIAFLKENSMVMQECSCMKQRRTMWEMEHIGLGNEFQKCSFASFQTNTEFRKIMLSRALQFVKAEGEHWFYIGGQTGCGKTHLCTAICSTLIQNGRHVKYLLWRDALHYMESQRFNKEHEYQRFMDEIREEDILYLDDFLKSETAYDRDGRILLDNGVPRPARPSSSELKYAYEIINARSISGRKTIISSEHLLDEISAYDSAISGRIKQHAGNGKFIANAARFPDRNYRLEYEEQF